MNNKKPIKRKFSQSKEKDKENNDSKKEKKYLAVKSHPQITNYISIDE